MGGGGWLRELVRRWSIMCWGKFWWGSYYVCSWMARAQNSEVSSNYQPYTSSDQSTPAAPCSPSNATSPAPNHNTPPLQTIPDAPISSQPHIPQQNSNQEYRICYQYLIHYPQYWLVCLGRVCSRRMYMIDFVRLWLAVGAIRGGGLPWGIGLGSRCWLGCWRRGWGIVGLLGPR